MVHVGNSDKQKATELVEVDVPASGLVSPAHEDGHHLNYNHPGTDDRTHDGSVDRKGHPVFKSSSGGFKAASFIIGIELGERLTFYGVQSTLPLYLLQKLGESIPDASRNVNNWTGVSLVMSVVGGFFADAYFGKYWIIATVSAIYVLGLLLLTLSAAVPSLKPPPPCKVVRAGVCPKVPKGPVVFFFFSLYLISLGTGGIKPCLEAFGADQFDDEDKEERKRKSSFFNWWYFALCVGGLLGVTLIVWINHTRSRAIALGILAIVMMVVSLIFYAGTPRYRHKLPGGSPFTQVAQVLVACLRNWHAKFPSHPSSLHEIYTDPSIPAARRQLLHTEKFKCLDKAAIDITSHMGANQHGMSPSGHPGAWKLCTVTQVEEVKLIIKLIPVWLTTFAYGVVFAQSGTLFVYQVKTLDNALGSFHIPPESFQALMTITVITLLPLYDRVLVPLARKLTGIERGITLLQRIGIGLFLSSLCMVAAALLEARRLRVASHNGLLDKPAVALPMSAFWIIPQYFLLGIADVFTLVGEQEFFYDQVPDSMRSLGMALYLSANGIGSFISTLLLKIVSSATGKDPWILPNNLNRSRVDRFYWLLAVLSMLNLMAFMVVAFFYEYKKVRSPLGGGVHNGVPQAHTGLSHKDSLQRYHHRPSNASSTSSQ